MIFILSDFHNNFLLAYTWTRLKNLEEEPIVITIIINFISLRRIQ